MAGKLDGQTYMRYAALGAGGAVVPGFVAGTAINATLAAIPFWGQAIVGATVGGIVLAGVGIGLVDQLFFSK